MSFLNLDQFWFLCLDICGHSPEHLLQLSAVHEDVNESAMVRLSQHEPFHKSGYGSAHESAHETANPSGDVIFSGQKMAQKTPKIA